MSVGHLVVIVVGESGVFLQAMSMMFLGLNTAGKKYLAFLRALPVVVGIGLFAVVIALAQAAAANLALVAILAAAGAIAATYMPKTTRLTVRQLRWLAIALVAAGGLLELVATALDAMGVAK